MYQQEQKGFPTVNGQWREFFFRANTNDQNTVQSVFAQDEYLLKDIYVHEKGIILDIGAHIGSFSILAATLKPDAKIYSFEPCAENMELFKKSIEINKLGDRISANLKAVWGKSDEVIKIFFGDETAFGVQHRFNCSHFAGWGRTDQDKSFEIETISLHDILEKNKIERVDVLKIDCEGSEYDIFNQTPIEDLKKIQLIVGEYHNIQKPPMKNPREELLKSLHGLFEEHSENQAGDVIMPKILADIPYHGNFLFRRKL